MFTNDVKGDQSIRAGQINIYPPSGPEAPRRVILILSANPRFTSPLRLDEERRAIDRAVVAARRRDRLRIVVADAVREADLPAALMAHQPTVVHFCGHAAGPDGLVVNDDRGFARTVPPDALGDLFGHVGRSVQCVVLNACLAGDQAMAVARRVPCVVGMVGQVPDSVAIRFAESFYAAVASGESVLAAVGLGRHMVLRAGHPEAHAPVLFSDRAVAERTIIAD